MKFADLNPVSLTWGFFSVLPWAYALWASYPKRSISFGRIALLSIAGFLAGIASTYLILEVNPLIWPDVDITARRPKSLLTQTIHFAFIQAGMVEESFKISFILILGFFLARTPDKKWDRGIFLIAGFTALGFAFIENSYYIMSEIPEKRLDTYLGRTIHSSNIHLLINLCFALFCLKSNEVESREGRWGILAFAFLLAVVQHGVVDFFLIPSSNLGGWIATAMFVGIWVWVVKDFRIWVLEKKTVILSILLVLSSLLPLASLDAQDSVRIPRLQTRVTDLTGILSSRTKGNLEGQLAQLEEKKGSQFAILIVPSTKPDSIEEYSMRVAENWKLGRKGADDGLLLLVAFQDRKVRIEVGYGLEGAIPDVIAKRIIDQLIVPEFKKGNYEAGILEATRVLIQIIETEEIPESLARESVFRDVSSEDEMVLILIFGGMGLVFFLVGFFIIFRSNTILAISLSVFAILGIVILVAAFQSIFTGMAFGLFISGVISFIIGIGASTGTGGHYSGSGYSGGYSGSYGGSGGGGFGGGGGSFGGGGSSGSW